MSSARQISENPEMIELLATCRIANIADDLAAPANAARASVSGVEVYIDGLVDAAAEQQRLAKRREELTKQIAGMRGRLANESYVAKAPAKLVQQTREQLAAGEEELAKLG